MQLPGRGYQFDEHGQVKLKAVDEQFLRVSKEERNLVEQANSWLKLFEKRTPNTEWKTFLSTSLADLPVQIKTVVGQNC